MNGDRYFDFKGISCLPNTLKLWFNITPHIGAKRNKYVRFGLSVQVATMWYYFLKSLVQNVHPIDDYGIISFDMEGVWRFQHPHQKVF